jgi:hypothetical protein
MTKERSRLFFWIDGAPEDRQGGPWWYQDFMSDEERDRFLDDTERFLHRYVCCGNTDMPHAHPTRVVLPPPSCEDCKRTCENEGPRGVCVYCGWSK